jgi:hypothetical protein
LIRFYDEIINGQINAASPKWIGVNAIAKKLQDTSDALDGIATRSRQGFGDTAWTSTAPKNFEDKLKSIYSTYSTSSLANPNPANSLKGGVTTITPLYIKNLGDYSKSSTTLNTIYQEFDAKIKGSISLVDTAKAASSQIDSNINSIKSSINDIVTKVNSFKSGLSPVETDFINQAIDYVKNI